MIIGLDVGGTHTDVVLFTDGVLSGYAKVATDPGNLFDTVLSGLEKITEGIDVNRLERIVLSTTLTTNAIVEDKCEPVGMIVSSGPGINPDFYSTGEFYFPVSGSIDHRGREVGAMDKKQVDDVYNTLKKNGIQYVGVVGKYSVRNSCHEIQIYDYIKDSFEKTFMGHRISGNLNFPRRIATTHLNASVYPIHRDFFQAVIQSLEKKGMNTPIHILKSDGGTMNFQSSVDFPGQTILSGPAASVMGSITAAPEEEDCLALDIGGTTTDMAVLIRRAPLLNPQGIELGRFQTLVRSLETHSIGVGGDSRVRVENGRVVVGPERRGPAMAFGGNEPTPTDALVVLGLMEDGDKNAAAEAIKSIAEPLGLSLEKAAERVFDTACEMILNEAGKMIDRINSKPVYTVHELKEGYQVAPKKFVVLGGPAPYFAKRLQALSDFSVSVVPNYKVANAIGAALARTTCEVTLFADTERGVSTAPEEEYYASVDKNYSREKAVETAFELLKQKAKRRGAKEEELEMEVLENLQFNMVRGFYTTGRNIRVKVQVKPGLIHPM